MCKATCVDKTLSEIRKGCAVGRVSGGSCWEIWRSLCLRGMARRAVCLRVLVGCLVTEAGRCLREWVEDHVGIN